MRRENESCRNPTCHSAPSNFQILSRSTYPASAPRDDDVRIHSVVKEAIWSFRNVLTNDHTVLRGPSIYSHASAVVCIARIFRDARRIANRMSTDGNITFQGAAYDWRLVKSSNLTSYKSLRFFDLPGRPFPNTVIGNNRTFRRIAYSSPALLGGK